LALSDLLDTGWSSVIYQRGVDNQGFPMQMEGKIEGVDLVLRYQDEDTLYKSIFRRVEYNAGW
jgi:hypothetical protein